MNSEVNEHMQIYRWATTSQLAWLSKCLVAGTYLGSIIRQLNVAQSVAIHTVCICILKIQVKSVRTGNILKAKQIALQRILHSLAMLRVTK